LREVENVLQEYARQLGGLSAPISIRQLASVRSIRDIVVSDSVDGDANLIPTNGGFLLKVRKRQWRKRMRFSCAHEIAHTFFYDVSKPVPTRPLGSLMSDEEEELCDIAAAELLMPSQLIRRYTSRIKEKELTCKHILHLSDKFMVSQQSIARKLWKDLSLWSRTLIIGWRFSQNKKELKIDWFQKPREFRGFIPLSKRAHPQSLIYEALYRDEELLTREKLDIGTLREEFEYRVASYGNPACVMTLISLDSGQDMQLPLS